MPRLVYRFGDCTIDPSARELRCAGALATLSPKVFDVLAYLIEHRDRAVGRDELIAAVWGKIDVTDTLLGQTVLKARRAIGNSGDGQSAIRTIPRFGYRWVAELTVEERADAAVTGTAADEPERRPTHRTPAVRARMAWTAAAIAIAAIATGAENPTVAEIQPATNPTAG